MSDKVSDSMPLDQLLASLNAFQMQAIYAVAGALYKMPNANHIVADSADGRFFLWVKAGKAHGETREVHK